MVMQATICRTNSLESKIRTATKEAVKEIQGTGGACGCGRSVLAMTGCRSCLMREISGHLRNAGYDSAVCKTKWRSSHHIPSGKRTNRHKWKKKIYGNFSKFLNCLGFFHWNWFRGTHIFGCGAQIKERGGEVHNWIKLESRVWNGSS